MNCYFISITLGTFLISLFTSSSVYCSSVSHPFLGDYVRLRQNVQWKKICVENNDQYVVFADIVNKIARSSGKYVPILLVLSTSSMLLLDQRTLQIKYRVPASEIYRMSLSPFIDDIAVFHVKAVSFLFSHFSFYCNVMLLELLILSLGSIQL